MSDTLFTNYDKHLTQIAKCFSQNNNNNNNTVISIPTNHSARDAGFLLHSRETPSGYSKKQTAACCCMCRVTFAFNFWFFCASRFLRSRKRPEPPRRVASSEAERSYWLNACTLITLLFVPLGASGGTDAPPR